MLRRSVALNDRTKEVFGALNELVRAPTTNQALRGLTRTVGIMNPLVRFLGPYQTVCNGWNYLFTYPWASTSPRPTRRAPPSAP